MRRFKQETGKLPKSLARELEAMYRKSIKEIKLPGPTDIAGTLWRGAPLRKDIQDHESLHEYDG